MLKKFFIFLLSSVIIIVTTFGNEERVQAANLQNLDKETKDFLLNNKQTVSEMKNLNQNQVKKLLEKHGENPNFIMHTEGSLDFNNAFGKKYRDIDIIYIPIAIENVSEDLNFSFFSFSVQKGKIKNYDEIVIIGDDQKYTTEVTVYKDGLLMGNEKQQLTKEHFEKSVSINQNDDEISTMGIKSWFSKFNKCLASQGIAAWVITSISIACGFACGTLTPACAACLVGAGLITEGVVTWCIGVASR